MQGEGEGEGRKDEDILCSYALLLLSGGLTEINGHDEERRGEEGARHRMEASEQEWGVSQEEEEDVVYRMEECKIKLGKKIMFFVAHFKCIIISTFNKI